MANTNTKAQPAKEKPAKSKPATKKPAVVKGVGIKELAADLDRTPKSVRAAIRRLKGGPQVGKGGQYNWPSRTSPTYKEILKALKGGTSKAVKTEDEAAA